MIPPWDFWFGTQAVLWGAPVTPAEGLAFVAAVAMVVCNLRVNPWGWPLGILSSLLYAALFWRSRLYGEAGLQIFFVVLSLWGWWSWLHGGESRGGTRGVRRLSPCARVACVAAVAIAWPLLGTWLSRHTDSDVPYWDAFPTVVSVLGQFLLGRKLVENWPTWLVVNVVSLALYAHKGLWLTVALYAWFVGMSVWGWRVWQRLLTANPARGA